MTQWLDVPRGSTASSAAASPLDHVVGAGLEEAAQRQHHDQRRHAEGDDDGREHQGLRQRIGVARRAGGR